LDGSVVSSFSAGTGFDGTVNDIKRYDSNSLFVVGGFFSYQGIANSRTFVKIDNDGNYISGGPAGLNGLNSTPNTVELLNDGKILLGGQFVTYSGTSANRILKLNSDYTLDGTFNYGTGFNNTVQIIKVQNDNKILVGGVFTFYSGFSANYLIRLNADGSKDDSFNIGTGFNSTVFSITIQSDDKILVGGSFSTFSGTNIGGLIRLNADGSKDETFEIGNGFSGGTINAITVQPDNKILVGGGFTNFSGISVSRIIRLNSNGTVDNTFNGSANSNVRNIHLLSNGRILITGMFTNYNSYEAGRIATLNDTGGLIDCTFSSPTPTPTMTRTPTLTPTNTTTPTLTPSSTPPSLDLLLQEDGGELLQEDGGNILIE
jgi:uncharacterized delta-60 repeat protein